MTNKCLKKAKVMPLLPILYVNLANIGVNPKIIADKIVKKYPRSFISSSKTHK